MDCRQHTVETLTQNASLSGPKWNDPTYLCNIVASRQIYVANLTMTLLKSSTIKAIPRRRRIVNVREGRKLKGETDLAEPQLNMTGALPHDIAPIENIPLRLQVADRLRVAILSGRLRPGVSLVETALAEQMNVSRAPIREAIQILENDGLVETIAYKGKRVKPLTVREVTEIYSLREVYEVMAARRIIENGTSVKSLRKICDDLKAAAEANDFEALILADEMFHRELIELADHDLLFASWKNLYLRIHQIMSLRRRDDRTMAEIAGNHPPIVDAIEAGDTARVIELVSVHTHNLADFDPADIAEI